MNKVFWLRKLVLMRSYIEMHEQDVIGTLCFIAGMGTMALTMLIIGIVINMM